MAYTAMNANYESIDVYCSWKNEYEFERVNNKNLAFETMSNTAKLYGYKSLEDAEKKI